jgi:hypothetical protein
MIKPRKHTAKKAGPAKRRSAGRSNTLASRDREERVESLEERVESLETVVAELIAALRKQGLKLAAFAKLGSHRRERKAK